MKAAANNSDICCPPRLVLDRIGDKWSVLIVLNLGDGPKRFSELRELLHHVTPKVLTHTLRGMERDGLVTRTVFAEVPPRVEYELTSLGHSLRPVMEPINTWAAEHVDEVLSLRKAHDARSADEFVG
ncbi:helix-turn-helix transcriptional regulator [Streptomyces sp. NBC_00487]|uniref:winged helix-turn-helix transcriptional regulator n=1 Tax=unclassified Streptomyces TaxID=2593676 RepID=UPI002DDB01F6|nr:MULTISPECIES: helix-turn-helix domain-containing protein [unclassified Streptomyces]WRY97663.1 helix-turn-helix transcriptional regulator [Streptomyces sp. NBC_00481]